MSWKSWFFCRSIMQSQIDQRDRDLLEIRRELNCRLADLISMNARFTAGKTSISVLESENSSLKDEIDRQKKIINASRADVEKAFEERSAAIEAKETAEHTAKARMAYCSDFESLKKMTNSVTARLNQVIRERDSLRMEIHKAKEEISNLNRGMKNLVQKMEASEVDLNNRIVKLIKSLDLRRQHCDDKLQRWVESVREAFNRVNALVDAGPNGMPNVLPSSDFVCEVRPEDCIQIEPESLKNPPMSYMPTISGSLWPCDLLSNVPSVGEVAQSFMIPEHLLKGNSDDCIPQTGSPGEVQTEQES